MIIARAAHRLPRPAAAAGRPAAAMMPPLGSCRRGIGGSRGGDAFSCPAAPTIPFICETEKSKTSNSRRSGLWLNQPTNQPTSDQNNPEAGEGEVPGGQECPKVQMDLDLGLDALKGAGLSIEHDVCPKFTPRSPFRNGPPIDLDNNVAM